MKKTNTITAFLIVYLMSFSPSPCNDCGYTNCIYEQIESVYDQSEMDLNEAILSVCKERGISDLKTIDLIKANYNL